VGCHCPPLYDSYDNPEASVVVGDDDDDDEAVADNGDDDDDDVDAGDDSGDKYDSVIWTPCTRTEQTVTHSHTTLRGWLSPLKSQVGEFL